MHVELCLFEAQNLFIPLYASSSEDEDQLKQIHAEMNMTPVFATLV